MSKRVRSAATLAMVAILGACADRGEPGGDDPAKIECQKDQYLQVADGMPSRSYDTKLQAAEAFVQGWSADGEPTDDAELVPLGGADFDRVAVRIDGRTVAILNVEGEDGNWSIGGYKQC
jgi:hypothetical protein